MPSAPSPLEPDRLKRKLSEYALAEDRGVSLLTQMYEFAPGEEERGFLAGQIEDEKKHNRLFQARADELNATEHFFLESLEKLYDLGQRAVSARDWIRCIACQSIIEELALASFASLFQRADQKTRAILLEIMADEKRHLAFTFDQIAKWGSLPAAQQTIFSLQKEVLALFLEALKPKTLALTIPNKEEQRDFATLLKKTYTLHRQRFEKLGMEVPTIRISFPS